MNVIQLQDDWPADATVLDVRLEADFLRAHLPGAVNACVFEMAFLDSVRQRVSENNQPIVVYGFGKPSREASMAADKLERAGYSNVNVFAGGLATWQEAGRSVEGNGEAPEAHHGLADGTYHLNLEESRLEWLGRNLLNKHWGTVGIASGSFVVADGALQKGNVQIDMSDLHCTDLAGSKMHDVLIQHLKSDDFFDTERYPHASFTLTNLSLVEGAGLGAPNLRATGELTLKDTTEMIDFVAAGGLTPEGLPAAQAAFAIDRTRWNVVYGSGKLFQHLGGHLVNDQIEFQLRLVARPVS